MEYEVIETDDVPRVDMGNVLNGLIDADARRVQAELGTEEMVVNVWYYEPGEEMPHHIHDEQEELFYVLEGEFELALGEEGDTERERIGPGTFYAAGPGVGHGHKNVGDEEGAILSVGAPNVADINPESWTPVDEA